MPERLMCRARAFHVVFSACACGGEWTNITISPAATPPLGRLTQKHQRQVLCSENTQPISGPATLVVAKPAPIIPVITARFSGLVVKAKMVYELDEIPAAARSTNDKSHRILSNSTTKRSHLENKDCRNVGHLERKVAMDFIPGSLEECEREEEGWSIPSHICHCMEFVGYTSNGIRDYGGIKRDEEDTSNQANYNNGKGGPWRVFHFIFCLRFIL
jgi:hypothetical protein